MNYIYCYESPLGGMTLASDGENLIGLWFDDQKFFGRFLDRKPLKKDLPVFEETIRWLNDYFKGKNPDFVPRLAPRGTAFQKEVWDILLTIPRGKTMTYGDIAGVLAKRKGIAKMSAQAVGAAVGHNPISLIIPCHRVVGKRGQLTGYAGGLDRKEKLLLLEKQDLIPFLDGDV